MTSISPVSQPVQTQSTAAVRQAEEVAGRAQQEQRDEPPQDAVHTDISETARTLAAEQAQSAAPEEAAESTDAQQRAEDSQQTRQAPQSASANPSSTDPRGQLLG